MKTYITYFDETGDDGVTAQEYSQICDFVSFFIHLYFKNEYRREALPKRVANVIDDTFVRRVLITLKNSGRLNLRANESNQYGLVIYPK